MIKININVNQYKSIVEIVKSMFNFIDENVEFSCKIKSEIYNLPSEFDAGSLPENSLIIIDYEPKITNEVEFSIDCLSKKQKIQLSDINMPLNKLKQEIQNKLELFEYSITSFYFNFYENQLDENKKISDYKINNSIISITVKKTLLVSLLIKEKKIEKYFSEKDTINDVNNLLKIQFKRSYDFDLLDENDKKYDQNFNLFNNMIIKINCNNIKIISNGSIGNRIFNVSEILNVSEAVRYLFKEIRKTNPNINLKDITIFIHNKNCFVEVDLNKKLYEFHKQLYLHKIVNNISFDRFSLKVTDNKKISECNSVEWLIYNFISKKVLIDPKNIVLKQNENVIDKSKLIYYLFNEQEFIISIDFDIEQNKQKIVESDTKQKIVEESINYKNDDIINEEIKSDFIENKNNFNKEKDLTVCTEEEEEEEELFANDEFFKDIQIPIINLNEYTVIKDIGEGQYGEVKLVENNKTHKLYAVKVAFDDCTEKENRRRIMMEIKSQFIGENAAILKLIGINFKDFDGNDSVIIFTEYMKNDSLLKNLKDEYKSIASHDFTPTKKYIILLGIALGMKYLHFQGIIHRDLKPANILLDNNFYPHICDFGFSLVMNFDTHMTNCVFKDRCGTPSYMAPEVINGENYTYKADVFSFAFIAYEILAGKPPYPERISYTKLLLNLSSGKRPNLSLIKDEDICNFLNKCWNNDPSLRPTFNDIVEELMSGRYRKYFEADEIEIEEYLNLFSVSLKTFNCDLP